MKTEFKAKFLQHVAKRKREGGFTLIELLVVIIIIGILSAIALPSFLNQANKAKQSEAKQYISSINKGQQAYYAENTSFGTEVAQLGLGLKTETTNYEYKLSAVTTGGGITSAATPLNLDALKGYGGAVDLVDAGEASTTQTILCETNAVGAPVDIVLPDGSAVIACPAGMSEVTK
jgi:type IV pilus assembly protein PilA